MSSFEMFLEEYEARREQLLGELLDAKRRCDLVAARQRRQRRRQIRRRGAPGQEDVPVQSPAIAIGSPHRPQQQEEEVNNEDVDDDSNNDNITEEEMQLLVMRALGLYEEYYEQRSRVAHCNVFQLFSPAWATSLECAFCWIAGFRPTAMFSLVNTAVDDLSPDQSLRMHRLLGQTRVEERALSEELAKVQESVAAPPVVDPAKRAGRRHIAGRGGPCGCGGHANEALEALQVAMETLLANADSLRTTTAANVVEILNTPQNIKFLTAATQLQRNLKVWGLELDSSAFQRVRG